MKKLIYCFLAVILFGCGDENSNSENTERVLLADIYFPNFPKAHFQGLILGSQYTAATKTLEDQGYSQKENQQTHYVNDELQIEVILIQNSLLQSFKVFFFNEEDLVRIDEFRNFFGQIAMEEFPSRDFCVYNFKNSTQEFSVTMFIQPDFIRLHYELQSSQ